MLWLTLVAGGASLVSGGTIRAALGVMLLGVAFAWAFGSDDRFVHLAFPVCGFLRVAIVGLVLACATSTSAQKLDVKIVDRQDNETEYTYVVPEHFSSQTSTNVNCSVNPDNVACRGSSRTSGSSTPSYEGSYHVRGATLALQLPDKRIAVVNCESKFAEHFAGHAGNHRSCRVPLVDNIQAEFKGDKAKLMWIVSIDGKKTQSETYKILAVLDEN